MSIFFLFTEMTEQQEHTISYKTFFSNKIRVIPNHTKICVLQMAQVGIRLTHQLQQVGLC